MNFNLIKPYSDFIEITFNVKGGTINHRCGPINGRNSCEMTEQKSEDRDDTLMPKFDGGILDFDFGAGNEILKFYLN